MDVIALIALFRDAGLAAKAIHGLGAIPGFVHKRRPAEILGVKGWLVWDYIIYNEIFFEDAEQKISVTFFQSISDAKTEEEWNELVERYGI